RGRGVRGAVRQLPRQHAVRIFLRRAAPRSLAGGRDGPGRLQEVSGRTHPRRARLQRLPAKVRRSGSPAGAAPAGIPSGPRKMTATYNAMELMICCAARCLEDGKTVAVGTGVPCATAMLAQRTHAPNLVIVFEAGGVAPQLPTMPISVGDSR